MSLVEFMNLPDTARLWCFGADRDLADTESEVLAATVARFVERWTAHDQRLAAGFEWRDARFLLVAVDEGVESASGCSIDSLLRQLRTLESELSVNLADGRLVWFRDADGTVQSVPRDEFRDLASRGKIGPDTAVFDLSLTDVGQVRSGGFELLASEGWHSRYLSG
jgi:hypothetical protein